MATDPATARSEGFGESATQTEPPKCDAAVQAEVSNLTTANPPAPALLAPPVEGSRPATRVSRPATRDQRLQQQPPPPPPPQSRPPTQSRGKPSTAASVASLQAQQRLPTQRVQPPTPAESISDHLGGGQPGVLFVDNHRAWQQFQESSPDARQHGAECTPMVYSYNPDPRLRAWQSLEHARLHQMGLSSKLSRRYNVQRSRQFVPVGLHMRALQPGGQGELLRAALLPSLAEELSSDRSRKKNDVAPFLTFQKPTCGYFFSRETENRKIKHGLAPADLPKWGGALPPGYSA